MSADAPSRSERREPARGVGRNRRQRGLPPGPWVLVRRHAPQRHLGAHRRAGHLGLAVPAPDDLVAGPLRQPRPLREPAPSPTSTTPSCAPLGGRGARPPSSRPVGSGRRRSSASPAAPRIAARRAFPRRRPGAVEGPSPCASSSRCGARSSRPRWSTVFLWRAPLAVARSLRSRQGFPVSLGLALWERYTRDALAALAGHAVYVMRYEELLADPTASITGGWPAGWRRRCAAAIATDAAAIAAAVSSVSRTGWLAHEGDGDASRRGPRERRTPDRAGRARTTTLPEPPTGAGARRGWPTPSPSAAITRSSTPGTCATSSGEARSRSSPFSATVAGGATVREPLRGTGRRRALPVGLVAVSEHGVPQLLEAATISSTPWRSAPTQVARGAERGASPGVVEQAAHRRASASTSPGSTSTPLTPSSMSRRGPSVAAATTALPAAMASSTASPKDSARDGCTTTSDAATRSSLSGGRTSPGMTSRSPSP